MRAEAPPPSSGHLTPVPATPAGGTPRMTPMPGAPRSRARQTTAHDLQTSSQELVAERGYATPFEVDVRTTLRRLGRLEDRMGRAERREKSTYRWTKWGTLGLGVLYLSGDKVVAWAAAHADLAYGLVGLGGSILGAFLVVMRARPREAGESEGFDHTLPPGGV